MDEAAIFLLPLAAPPQHESADKEREPSGRSHDIARERIAKRRRHGDEGERDEERRRLPLHSLRRRMGREHGRSLLFAAASLQPAAKARDDDGGAKQIENRPDDL